MKLAEINEKNIYDVMALKLTPDQVTFVRDPLFSLAESYYYRDDETVSLFALEENGIVVGFLSLYTEIEEKAVYIWRIVIGEQFQFKGYGRKALREIDDYIYNLEEEYEKVVADYVVGNEAMKHLLETEGYIETGKQEDCNEIIMTKTLKKQNILIELYFLGLISVSYLFQEWEAGFSYKKDGSIYRTQQKEETVRIKNNYSEWNSYFTGYQSNMTFADRTRVLSFLMFMSFKKFCIIR